MLKRIEHSAAHGKVTQHLKIRPILLVDKYVLRSLSPGCLISVNQNIKFPWKLKYLSSSHYQLLIYLNNQVLEQEGFFLFFYSQGRGREDKRKSHAQRNGEESKYFICFIIAFADAFLRLSFVIPSWQFMWEMFSEHRDTVRIPARNSRTAQDVAKLHLRGADTSLCLPTLHRQIPFPY